MANLYQIRAEVENFVPEVDEETGEFLNAPAWDELNLAYEEKVENTACYIKNLRADISALKAEEDALAKRRKTAEKKAAWLEKMLLDNMDGAEYASARCAIGFRKSVKVEVKDATAIPENFLRVKTTVEPDKKAIGALLKEGKAVPGCVMVESQNIQIR